MKYFDGDNNALSSLKNHQYHIFIEIQTFVKLYDPKYIKRNYIYSFDNRLLNVSEINKIQRKSEQD